MKIYQIYKNLHLDIIEIDCSKISKKCYWDLNGNRYSFDTNYTQSFKSREDAELNLEHKIKSKISAIEEQLQFYKDELNLFYKQIKTPTLKK